MRNRTGRWMRTPGVEARPAAGAGLPRALRGWARGLLAVLVALLVVVTLDARGVVAGADASVRAGEAELAAALGVSRESRDAIVLVAGNADTVAAWGPPPWPASRRAELLAALAIAEPDAIAFLGHAPMFVDAPGSSGDAPGLGEPWGRASTWSASGGRAPQPLSRLGALELDDEGPLAQLGRRSELVGPIPERLAIAWQTPAARLPVVPAHELASGRVPPATFTGRVVVVGVTDPVYERPLATPIGALSPVEVEAHALLGLVDGRVGAELPEAWAWLIGAVWAGALALGLGRGRVGLAVLASLGLALGLLGFDLLAGLRGAERIVAARPILIAGAAVAWLTLTELVAVVPGLTRLRARVVHELAGLSARAASASEARAGAVTGTGGFWRELAELGAGHVAALTGTPAATIVLARPSHAATAAARAGAATGAARVELRACAGLDEVDVARALARAPLDLRRAPLRAAYLTGKPVWAPPLVSGASHAGPRKALVIPLIAEARLLGVWLVQVPERAALDARGRARCEELGQQMAAAILRRQRRAGLELDGATPRAALAAIDAGLSLIHAEQVWALDLLAQLPVAALIATVWGELEFVDPRLRQRLACRCPGLFVAEAPAPNLVDVLARLTGGRRSDARRWLREVVVDGRELELAVAAVPADPHAEPWILAPLRGAGPSSAMGAGAGLAEHVLLMARGRDRRARRKIETAAPEPNPAKEPQP